MNAPQKFTPLPSLPPPAATTGPLGWVRANLLSSPLNALLTLGTLWLLFELVPPAVRWALFDATISGGSSADCKTTDAAGVEVDAAGACWTFLKVRFWQIMFGLYFGGNTDQLWRPLLMFGLLAAFAAPLFMPSFRRKILLGAFLIFVFPFIGFALLHGEWLGLPVADTSQWGGFLLTFVLAAIGIVAALPLGIVLALGRRSNMPMVRAICVFYIEFWRGAPLITVLFMASVMLPLFFPSEVEFDKVARALFGITMFQSAYTAEAVRGGLQAVSRGQYEAADALAMGYWKKTGLIILPQALKISIPNIVSTFIGLFKDTTLVLIIGLLDLLNMAQTAARSSEWKGYDLEGYVFAAAIFFICCFAMSKYSQALEKKLETGHKREA